MSQLSLQQKEGNDVRALELRFLNKYFHTFQALHNVNLELEEGQLLAILGPSGCGKTTLLRCIAGFEPPSTGDISIYGQPMYSDDLNIPPEKRRVSFVPQEG